MSGGWNGDKAWSDRFLPEIKRSLGEVLIGEATLDEDQQRNTDLIVLRMEAVRIACRIRRPGYWDEYASEFTIRADRPSGVKTELAKIIEGWGQYFFYGHSNDAETALRGWGIGNLNAFRLWFNSYIVNTGGKIPGTLMPNRDGSSSFRAFQWRTIPGFVVASGGELQLNVA